LKARLKREVSRTFGRNSSLSLEQLYSEAEMEESLLKPVLPSVRGVNGRNQSTTRSACFFCRSKEHLGKDCRKVAARKRNGTRVEKPPKQGGAARSLLLHLSSPLCFGVAGYARKKSSFMLLSPQAPATPRLGRH
jgi:hypothetical protein